MEKHIEPMERTFIIQRRPDEVMLPAPSIREMETPWYNRFNNKRRNKGKKR